MELLSPAGSLEKLKYAYQYGADAAYIGVGNFSLRSRADHMHPEEYREMARIKGDRKLYGALNMFFRNRDIDQLEADIDGLASCPLDGFIISDMGIVRMLQQRFPDIPLHLSTQANCMNREAVRFYRDAGFKRIILAREVSLQEIEGIKRAAGDMEVEVFVHGAMCIAYSGRCLMSSWMIDRSANQGDCAHSCRWDYRVLEEQQRPGEYYPVEGGEDYTALFSSKDLCMIDHLRELRDAGADSLKIEGRMKSLYYTAVVTRAYRKALDCMDRDDSWSVYREDLFKVSHREYSTGFFFGSEEMNTPSRGSYMRSHLFLGTVGEAVAPGRYRLDIKNQIRMGEPVEFIGPDIPFIEDASYEILDADDQPAEQADHGKEYTISPSVPVQPGYIIRKTVG